MFSILRRIAQQSVAIVGHFSTKYRWIIPCAIRWQFPWGTMSSKDDRMNTRVSWSNVKSCEFNINCLLTADHANAHTQSVQSPMLFHADARSNLSSSENVLFAARVQWNYSLFCATGIEVSMDNIVKALRVMFTWNSHLKTNRIGSLVQLRGRIRETSSWNEIFDSQKLVDAVVVQNEKK